MTDSETRAQTEIMYMKTVNSALKAAKTSAKRMAIFKRANLRASKFKDVENNNIGDFFAINAKDNCHLGQNPSEHDFHQMCYDEIKAIKSDTQTLLNE